MKSLKYLFWLTGAFILLFSCKKEKSIEGTNGPAALAQWEFKDSTLLFNGKMDTAFYLPGGFLSSVVLQGTSTDGSSDFYLEVFSPNIIPGTYKSPDVQFQYALGGVILYESIPANTDNFSVTITSIDSNNITGTFTGEVEDALGNKKTITGGIFAAQFRSTTNPPQTGNGQLMLWSKIGCSSGNLAVKVQNQTGTITSFHASAPACGTTGAANFTLPAGVYTWEAYCPTDTARGNIIVTPGNCSTVEVVFGVISTNCIISNLAYYDYNTNIALGSLSSFFNPFNQVNSVLFVDSITNTALYSFAPNKTTNRINIDAQQYFDLDASGRIKEFHGYIDATEVSLPRVIITYTFNAGGYLEKAAYAFEAAPTINFVNTTYTWTGGNLSKIVVQEPGKTDRVEYEYQYDLSKPAKNFLCFFPNSEIMLLQSAINFGNNSSHVLTTSSIKEYDATGGIVTTDAVYEDYIIDSDNYVKGFSIIGDGSVYSGNAKYIVTYKCF